MQILGNSTGFRSISLDPHHSTSQKKIHALYTSLATVESQYYICILGCLEYTDRLSKAKLCSGFSKKKYKKRKSVWLVVFYYCSYFSQNTCVC